MTQKEKWARNAMFKELKRNRILRWPNDDGVEQDLIDYWLDGFEFAKQKLNEALLFQQAIDCQEILLNFGNEEVKE